MNKNSVKPGMVAATIFFPHLLVLGPLYLTSDRVDWFVMLVVLGWDIVVLVYYAMHDYD